MKTKAAIILIVILPAICLAYPVPVDFYTDGTIQDGDAYGVVSVFNNATVDMTGGFIQTLGLYDSSTFNAYGGEWTTGGFPDFMVLESATLNLYYLQVPEYHRIWTEGDLARINVYGYNFQYVPASSDWLLYGNWPNGEEFCLRFRGPWTHDYVILHEIPEPCTLTLLLLGAFLVKKKNR